MRHMILLTIVKAILFAQIININAQGPQPIKGRLLTGEEGCGYSKVANSRVVGGAPARPGQYPWMALLGAVQNNVMNFVCGGSLITSRHVLTAAHCIIPGLSIVRLGEHDKSTTADGPHQDIKVSAIAIHPQYTDLDTGDGTNDIAILILERDVDFNDRIGPICLPVQKEFQTMNLVLQNPFVAGWGVTQYGGQQASDVLKHIQLPVLSNAICELACRTHLLLSSYKVKRTQFSQAVICAGNVLGGPGSSSGDSGGPLMLPFMESGQFRMYEIGIVSWAIPQAKAFTPGVYARVTNYVDWIQQVISQ